MSHEESNRTLNYSHYTSAREKWEEENHLTQELSTKKKMIVTPNLKWVTVLLC